MDRRCEFGLLLNWEKRRRLGLRKTLERRCGLAPPWRWGGRVGLAPSWTENKAYSWPPCLAEEEVCPVLDVDRRRGLGLYSEIEKRSRFETSGVNEVTRAPTFLGPE